MSTIDRDNGSNVENRDNGSNVENGDKGRGLRNRLAKNKKKRQRNLRQHWGFRSDSPDNVSVVSKKTGEVKEEDTSILRAGRRDRVRNEKNYKPRSRTESPPPKHRRSKKGFNKGSFCGCSHCRPEIANRVSKVAGLRREIRSIRKEKEYE